MKFLSITVLLVLSLTACISVPIHYREHRVTGRYLFESHLAFLEKGRTSRDEVVKELGLPTIWLETQRIAVYGVVVLPEVTTTTERPVQREATFIAFDQSNKVLDWGHSKEPDRKTWHRAPMVTWLSAALDWGRSSGLELAQPAQTFVEVTPPAQRSVVYFYRPRDVETWWMGGTLGSEYPRAESLSISIELYLDSTLLGEARWKSYLPLSLAPGTYDFQVSPNYPWSERWAVFGRRPDRNIQITLRPGLAYFVRIGLEHKPGKLPGVAVSQHSREEAMPILQALRETW